MGYYETKYREVSELLGKTITKIEGAIVDSEEILFTCSDGSIYKMYHGQECCESVMINDIIGDIEDLIGSPITMAEDVSNESENDEFDRDDTDESYTWTFYKFATVKGYVTLRWFGTSNGYYSESVDFAVVSEKEEK